MLLQGTINESLDTTAQRDGPPENEFESPRRMTVFFLGTKLSRGGFASDPEEYQEVQEVEDERESHDQ
jgi:hypothetical protein